MIGVHDSRGLVAGTLEMFLHDISYALYSLGIHVDIQILFLVAFFLNLRRA